MISVTFAKFKNNFFPPDYVFNRYPLYWNSGVGNRETYCLNADGNYPFHLEGSSIWSENWYIGNGLPDETGITGPKAAAAVIGLHIGKVSGDRSRTTTPNVGTVESEPCVRYERAYSVAAGDTQIGRVHSNLETSYTGYGVAWRNNGTSISTTDVNYGCEAYPVNNNIGFVGWYVNGEKITSTSSSDSGIWVVASNPRDLRIDERLKFDVSAEARFAKKFTVAFSANGGTGTMANQDFLLGESQNLSKCTFGAPSPFHVFDHWESDALSLSFEDEEDLSEQITDVVAGSTYTLVAQWRFVGFNLTATKTTGAGTLTLQKDGATVATESGGTLTYTGAADGAEYRLVCTMSDGYAFPPMPVSPTEGASLSLVFANPLHFVSLPAEDASGNSFSVTSPPAPDGTVDGKDAYAAGRNIVVTANLGDEQMMTAAYLDDENHVNFATYTGESIADGKFTITGIDRSCYVRGTFAVRQYSVTCAADAASASALTVAVSASSVVKNTQVTFTATPAAGYSFEGWYLDGVKIDGAGATYDRTITGETHLVAKAKVAVTLTLATADTGTITVNDEAYTPGTPFDVTLGETFDYAIEPVEGLRYRGWYTSDYPTSKVRYPVPQRGTWPAPSAAFTAVGVILAQAPVEPGTPLAVEIAFADGSDSTMGELSIDGGSDLSIVKPYTEDGDTGEPTTYVTLSAVAKNGYVFLGWYENAAGQGDAVKTPEYTFPLTEDVTLYARFAQNDHSICEWEGSKTPKALVWRSKTYAASKPFSPSACRVDALGYPPGNVPGTNIPKVLELKVDMFSAPDKDAKPTATATLTNIANQDARRLPVRRMERYMQVQVRCNREVDALLVGTSMEGLAV